MEHIFNKKIFFIPHNKNKRKEKCRKLLILFICSSFLAGCKNAHTAQSLALAPPEQLISQSTLATSSKANHTELFIIENSVPSLPEETISQTSLSKSNSENKCNLTHRFDRKALLAYEWNRSRLALDIDGVGLDWDGITDFEGIKLEYKIKLSPEKTKKEKCRYSSEWQGLIGSGYNEFILRKKNTVWDQLEETKRSLRKSFNNYF